MSTILNVSSIPNRRNEQRHQREEGDRAQHLHGGIDELFAQRGEPRCDPDRQTGKDPQAHPQCGAPQRRQKKLFELPRLFKLQKAFSTSAGDASTLLGMRPDMVPYHHAATRRTGTLILRAIEAAR